MPKKIPDCPNKKPEPVQGSSRRYEVELITPMFGGGVEPRLNDPNFPIRATAIRGQLQFWWRATVGAQYATRAELRTAQTEVWGSTERVSRVQVQVEMICQASDPKACAVIKPNHKGKDQVYWEPPFRDTALLYALFPFQGKPANREGPKVDPALCIHKASFRLTVICSKDIDFTKQVEPALWAWINFGGLGGRTRRGCGAITCKEFAPRDAAEIARMWQQYMPTTHPNREWPTLACSLLTGNEHPSAIMAWNVVIGRFQKFRQGVGRGRNPGQQQNRSGRSRYPEPETIRTALWDPQQPWAHQRLEQIPNDAFPRAELGLPIVFHFQGQGEPPDTVLYPSASPDGQKRERMASPLILKPLALQNGMAIPLILRLRTPELAGVDLRRGDTSLNLPTTTVIRDPRLSNYPNSPLQGSSSGSALEAFLAFARTEGFSEVHR
jgi:CRISPR-associated protein Cmr1